MHYQRLGTCDNRRVPHEKTKRCVNWSELPAKDEGEAPRCAVCGQPKFHNYHVPGVAKPQMFHVYRDGTTPAQPEPDWAERAAEIIDIVSGGQSRKNWDYEIIRGRVAALISKAAEGK